MFNPEFYKIDKKESRNPPQPRAAYLWDIDDIIDPPSVLSARKKNGKREEESEKREKEFPCKYCGLQFDYLGTLKSHERTHDAEEPYVCPTCKMSFRYYTDLERHSTEHRAVPGEKVFKCKCGRIFNKYSDLLYHEHPILEADPEFKETIASGGKEPAYLSKTPGKGKTFYCEFCLKGFGSAHDLKYHIYTHRGERQFGAGLSRYKANRTS